MPKLPRRVPILLVLIVFFASIAAHAENDAALSIYGAFNGTTNGNGTVQSPSNAAGGMLELRHISSPLFGYDVTYSYNRANQSYYSPAVCGSGTSTCDPWKAVSANAHQIAGNWLVSVHAANLRPFALAGVGLLLNEPAGSQTGASSSDKPVFVYGAGLDWGLLPHLGLRFQYRGNLYHAPDLATAFTSTGRFTHTAEPMIGAYFSF
jgi:opacity protein-like surface antigen